MEMEVKYKILSIEINGEIFDLRGKGNHKPKAVTQETKSSGKTKYCSSCKAIKPVEDFNRANASPDGRQYMCKKCQSSRDKIFSVCHVCKVKKPRSQFKKYSQTCRECKRKQKEGTAPAPV